jgi:FkbM family methyltransferase
MLTIERHGVTVRFDDTGFTEPPYVYLPLARGRWYEEAFLEHIRSLDRVGAYVDVGAHLGTHALWFAMLCRSTVVHAIEPVPRYADVIDRNVAANGLERRVVVHRVGVSDRAGLATNYLSREHQVGFVSDAEPVRETFEIVRLDELVPRPVAVIKLDIEGMELAALRGAEGLLEDRPVVFAEAHSEEELEAIDEALDHAGYGATGRVFNASPTYEWVARDLPDDPGRRVTLG